MGAFLAPIVMVLLYLGLQAQANQMNGTMPGQGWSGRAGILAQIQATQLELFTTACQNVAAANPGLISASIGVALPSGFLAPTGAVCATTAAAPSGRNVYAYAPAVPGEAGNIRTDTLQSVAWFRVTSPGQAVNLVTAQSFAVPASIPTGAVVAWILTTS